MMQQKNVVAQEITSYMIVTQKQGGSSSVVSKDCHLHCDFSDNYIYFVSDVMQEFGDKSNCNYIWHVNIMNAHSGAEKLETQLIKKML